MRTRRASRGGVLVMFAVSMVVIIACSGLAIDVGRMYVTRTEAQSFVDALALAKAAEVFGIRDATAGAGDVWKLYNFNNESFDGADVTVDFSTNLGFSSGTVTSTAPETGTVYVRARASVDVPLLLLRVLVPDEWATVSASAVAGWELLTGNTENTFPYTIRNPGKPLEVNQLYTFRWGNNVANDLEKAWKYVVANGPTDLNGRLIDTAKVLQGINPYSGKTLPNINYWCAGHANPDFLASILPASGTFDVVSQNLFSWTGAIYDGKSGAATIMDAIAFGWQSQEILINGSVSTATGVIQATANPLEDVINADTDKVNVTRDSYDGNHYRTVQVAVVAADSAYLKPASGATTTVTGLEQFLLLRVGDYGGPGSNWCVAYYGAADSTSEGPIDRPSGIWILRLVS